MSLGREAWVPVVPKDARIGATRNSVAGTASEMQDSGQPGDLEQG